ncbi:ATP-binding protein [Streptomyces monticola]|uniref:ATP-binding protein n=1 Tax=Streptomyces monticola TaxID=2666263 RepID=A0ABW2JLD7_9ACTN
MSGRACSRRFRMRRTSVSASRRHVETTLDGWGLGGLAEPAALVVSELATDAVVHATGVAEFFELTLSCRDGVLVVEVSDSCRWRMPELGKPGPDDLSGRGLLIVDALAQAWGVRPRDAGKTVWVHLAESEDAERGG